MNYTQDDYIKQFGTDEQKKELQERRVRLDEWLKQFPVISCEEAMARSFYKAEGELK